LIKAEEAAAEAAAVLEEISDHEKSIKPPAQIASKNVKFHSNQLMEDQSIAMIVLRIIENSK
jgi:hypothetical protein